MLKHIASAVLLAAVLLLTGTGCASTAGPADVVDNDVEHLAQWMTGTFSSAAQAQKDPDGFFDIRLVMQPVWQDRADGPWLYVEQAMASKLEKPYRQRVYQLRRGIDGAIQSRVFKLPGEQADYVGAWRGGTPLDELTPEQLVPRHGCTIYLRRVDRERFKGHTRGKGCKSTLAGADHATSDVDVAPGGLFAWDRGWDDQRHQVWGPEKGAYDFVKLSSAPPLD